MGELMKENSTAHPTDVHKFDSPMSHPLTYRERFQLEYASHFIPYLKILEQEIGREKVLESLRKLAILEAEEYARCVVQAKGKNDLTVFKEDYNPNTPGIKEILSIEVVEDTETFYEIRISECLWADVFQKAGAADYGYAAVCAGDVPFARCVNSQIDLELDGTLMEGKPFCNLRYFLKAGWR